MNALEETTVTGGWEAKDPARPSGIQRDPVPIGALIPMELLSIAGSVNRVPLQAYEPQIKSRVNCCKG